MDNRIFYLEAISPLELKGKLDSMLRGSKAHGRFVIMNVFGDQVLVRNFDLPVLAAKEIKNALRLEAVEVFSLPPEEIEIDYQILSSADGKYKGVFLAMPKSTLKDYYAEISRAGFIPLALTAKILTTINSALTQMLPSIKACYILDFIKEKSAFLALFNEGQCELIRDISYDDIAEAKQEIFNSLRYALGRSAAKHPEELYFSGEIVSRDELIANLENEFNVKATAIDLEATEASLKETQGYFKLNLIKEYTVSLALRHKLHRFFNLAIVAAALVFIFAFIGSLRLADRVKVLKKEFDPSKKAAGYGNKIKDLQEKINLLENEK